MGSAGATMPSMRQLNVCKWVIALALVACGDDDNGVAETEGDTETGTGTTTGPTTTMPGTTDPATTDPATTDTTTTETTTTDTGDTEDTSDTEDTEDTGDTEDTEAADDTTGGAEATYPACQDEDPECPRGFDLCIEYGINGSDGNLCSYDCTEDTDCPAPESGTAVAICGGFANDRCSLDCADDDAVCPDGMDCVSLFGGTVERCAWPTE
jgi:hypothetical protein